MSDPGGPLAGAAPGGGLVVSDPGGPAGGGLVVSDPGGEPGGLVVPEPGALGSG